MRRIKLKNNTSISRSDIKRITETIHGTGLILIVEDGNPIYQIDYDTKTYKGFVEKYVGCLINCEGVKIESDSDASMLNVTYYDAIVFKYCDTLIQIGSEKAKYYFDIIDFILTNGISEQIWKKYVELNYKRWNTKLSKSDFLDAYFFEKIIPVLLELIKKELRSSKTSRNRFEQIEVYLRNVC